jgi:glycerophosphoryl diester phosphodiesterase
MACNSISKPIDWQGHRGARGVFPENTIPAFLYAMQNPKITTLEMDLVITADKQVILSHEPWFSHEITTTPQGNALTEETEKQHAIYQMTLQDAQKYDVGLKQHPRFEQQKKIAAVKPSLAQLIGAIENEPRGKEISFNMEIKSQEEYDGTYTPSITEFASLVVDEIHRLGIHDRTTIQSFDVRALKAVHTLSPKIKLALLVENNDGFEVNLAKLGFIPQIYSPNYTLVDSKLISKCHDRNMQIIPWTVNSSLGIDLLINLGVDGIITDYPDLAN